MLKQEYINIKFRILEEYFDVCVSIFQDYDFCGIEEGSDEMTVTFTEETFKSINPDDLLIQIRDLDSTAKMISIDKITDRNWNEEWERQLQPVIVSDRIAITPNHCADDLTAEIKIIIDPKMSFGTGHHTTTRLMCQLLDGLVKQDSKWIDVGTGTGVLAILATKLGAKSVFAFDNNQWSIENAEENIIKNDAETSIKLALSDIDSAQLDDCDGIVANIFLNLAMPSLGKFRKAVEKSNGDILISGIMIYDEKLLIQAAKDNNLILVNKLTDEEWVAFHFKCGVDL